MQKGLHSYIFLRINEYIKTAATFLKQCNGQKNTTKFLCNNAANNNHRVVINLGQKKDTVTYHYAHLLSSDHLLFYAEDEP